LTRVDNFKIRNLYKQQNKAMTTVTLWSPVSVDDNTISASRGHACDTNLKQQVNSYQLGLQPVRKCRRGHKKKKSSKKRSSKTDWGTNGPRLSKRGQRIQRKKQGQYGIIAINSALGAKLLCRSQVDDVVHCIGRGCDDQGSYSGEVLHIALQRIGYRLRRVPGKQHMWLASQQQGKFLALGFHLSYEAPQHYIGVDADAGLVQSGTKENTHQLGVNGILACIDHGVNRIWRIEKL
jgi:hypothetical protein